MFNVLFLAAYATVLAGLWWPMSLPGKPGWPCALLLMLAVVGSIAALTRHLPLQNILLAAFAIVFASSAVIWLDAKTGILTTVAGDGTPGSGGDGGPAAKARLNLPLGLGLDGKGNLYVVDSVNARIRKIEGVAAP